MEIFLKASSTDFVSHKYREEFFFVFEILLYDIPGITDPTPCTPEVKINEDFLMHFTFGSNNAMLLFTSKVIFDVCFIIFPRL